MALFPIKLWFFDVSGVVELIVLLFVAGAVLFWVYLYISEYSKENKKLISKIFKREEKRESKPKLLRNFFLKTVATLESKINENNKEGTMKEFSLAFKKFFGELYSLDYRFTYDELIDEINKLKINSKHKERIINILNELSRMEYSEEKVSLERIKDIISESEKLVNDLMNIEDVKEEIKEIPKTAVKTKNTFQKFLLKLGVYRGKPVKERIEEARMIRSIKENIDVNDGRKIAKMSERIGVLGKEVGKIKKSYPSPLDNLRGKWLIIDTDMGSFKGRMREFDGDRIYLDYVIRMDAHSDDVSDSFEIHKSDIKKIGVEFVDEDMNPKIVEKVIEASEDFEKLVKELLPEIKAL